MVNYKYLNIIHMENFDAHPKHNFFTNLALKENVNFFINDNLNGLKTKLSSENYLLNGNEISYINLSSLMINLTQSVNLNSKNITRWLISKFIDNKNEIKYSSSALSQAFKNDFIIAFSKAIKTGSISLIKILTDENFTNTFPEIFNSSGIILYSQAIIQSLEKNINNSALYLLLTYPDIFKNIICQNRLKEAETLTKLRFLSKTGFQKDIQDIFDRNELNIMESVSRLHEKAAYILQLNEAVKNKDIKNIDNFLGQIKDYNLLPADMDKILQINDDDSFTSKEIIRRIQKNLALKELY
ncbi:MAG: hypothetical protein ACK4OM_03215 [Alphaproteobacteria bacterium]